MEFCSPKPELHSKGRNIISKKEEQTMDKKTITLWGILLIIAVIGIGIIVKLGATKNNPANTNNTPKNASIKAVTLRVAVPPDPNSIPFFVMLDQNKLKEQGVNIKCIPSKNMPEVMEHIRKGDVDMAIFSLPHGSKMYTSGVKTLRLVGVHLWKAIYTISTQDISGWKDLKGKKVLISFKGGPPDAMAKRSMKASGYNPDKDFQIEYPVVSDILGLLLSGKASAAVVPEPWASQLILKSKGKLKVAIDLQDEITKDIPVCKGKGVTMAGLWVIAPNVKGKEKAVRKFTTEFDKANKYAMNYPDKTSRIFTEYFLKYFHRKISPDVIAYSLKNNLLRFNFRKADQIKLIVPACVKAFNLPIPSDEMYYKGL